MDEVNADLEQQGILQEQHIVSAFRSFLISKSDGSARFITDLSPLTPFYKVPHTTLYRAARVLSTIRLTDTMIKVDLTSDFFQIRIHPQHQKYYGVFYRGRHLTLTRLPMGHPLAPYTAALIHSSSYKVKPAISRLHDRLLGLAYFWAAPPGTTRILATLQQMGFTISLRHVSSTLASRQMLETAYSTMPIAYARSAFPYPTSISSGSATYYRVRHLLAWAMNWPTFIATHLLQQETYWIRWSPSRGVKQTYEIAQLLLNGQYGWTVA
jgi:hypothetical protein